MTAQSTVPTDVALPALTLGGCYFPFVLIRAVTNQKNGLLIGRDTHALLDGCEVLCLVPHRQRNVGDVIGMERIHQVHGIEASIDKELVGLMESITRNIRTNQYDSLETFIESLAAHLHLAKLVYLFTVGKYMQREYVHTV